MNITTDIDADIGNSTWKILNEETAIKNSTSPYNIPENSVFYATIPENTEWEADYVNKEYINDSSPSYNFSVFFVVQPEFNDTLFLDYPEGLLCFGAVCFIVFAIVGVIGNFVSILALSKCKRLRNATTAFIVNLCVADLLFSSFSMPLSAVSFIEKNWYYGKVLCTLFALMRYSNGAVSLFSVIAITVNRYILIVHTKIYPVIYTKRNIAIMIVLIWVFSLLLLLPSLLGVWGTLNYDPKTGTCTIRNDDNGNSPKIFLYIAAFVIPSVIFVVCYTKIFLVVRKASKKTQRREDKIASRTISFTSRKGLYSKHYRHSEMTDNYVHHRDRKELRVLRVMLVVFVLFLICYFPVSFVKILHKEDDLHIMNVFGYLGVYFSNIVNPIIYIAMSKEYRKAYKELFCSEAEKQKRYSNCTKISEKGSVNNRPMPIYIGQPKA